MEWYNETMFFHPTPAFKAYVATQREHMRDYLVVEESLDHEGRPCSCHRCKSIDLEDRTTDSMDGLIMEYEVVCKQCLVKVAYWAHGSFEPNIPPEYASI